LTTPASNAPELLRREILEQARQQKEDILRQAREQAQTIAAQTAKAAEEFKRERLEAARMEAKRRTEANLATVPVEAGRIRMVRVEELLQAIHDRARTQIRDRAGFGYRETVMRLLCEALWQIAGETFRLRLCVAECRALGDGLAEEIRTRLGRPNLRLEPVADANLKEGELVLEDPAGRQAWNLSLEARLERCWPQLRRQIAAHPAFAAGSTP
jgi:vacuolar-type H+-ATPase subunit E/Vma4